MFVTKHSAICILHFALALFGLLLAERSSGVPRWEVISPWPAPGSIVSLDFISPDTGYLVNDVAMLLKTVNGGESWTEIASPRHLATGPWRIEAFNNRLALLGGTYHEAPFTGALFYTDNGGEDWDRWELGGDFDPFGPTAVTFRPALLGWVAGTTYDVQGVPVAAVYRNNGEINWTKTILPESRGMTIHDLHFANGSLGWAVGSNGYAARTDDGGDHWVRIATGTGLALHTVHFVNATTGIVAGGNFNTAVMLRTTNGGARWDAVETPARTRITGLTMLDNGQWVAISEGGNAPAAIMTSPDGIRWETALSSERLLWCLGSAGNTAYVGGSDGTLITARDGRNWRETTRRLGEGTIYDLHFRIPSTGWFCGEDGLFGRTDDGGATWSTGAVAEGVNIFAIHFTDDETGYAAGSTSREFRTEDAGRTWEPVSIAETQVSRIVFVGGRGFALAGDQVASTDDGLDWRTTVVTRNGAILTGLAVVNRDTLFVASPNDSMRKSTDGGRTWQRVATPFGPANDVGFLDRRRGYAVSIDRVQPRFYFTTDGGTNWQARGGFDFIPIGVSMPDEGVAWLRGGDGELMRSVNAGWTWQDAGLPARSIVRDVVPLGPDRAVVCGEGSLMARWGEDDLNAPVGPIAKPVNYEAVIFPNPANRSAQIRFGGLSSNVVLYDLRGREVLRSSGDVREAFNLDLTALPSGSYRVVADGRTSAVRLVVLK
ncbi:MAG: hypothetical protein FJY67_00765 [Calditrichaeota bacterium]|nr:hypothetical protein [Calditrichota bacterium]